MANILDERYVTALGNFNKSLAEVVELLQQQVNNKDTDILETMLKNMDSGKLGKIVEDLKEVKESTKKILSQNDKILEEIKSIKKQKESGGIGDVSDPKNKNKILDGIKIITLIAGGVLAIGLAFKLIGPVDVLSVIGLGVSISIMAATFTYISDKMKNVSFGKTLLLSGMMIIISLALVKSSKILMFTAPLTLKTIMSISFTATAMGLSLFLLTEAVSKIKFNLKNILGLLLLPFLAPIVSNAIVKSSQILKNTANIDFKTILSVGFTSVTIGIALFLLTKAVEKINFSLKTIVGLLLLPFLAPIVSFAIVKSSHILKNAATIDFRTILSVTFTSIALGIALYAITTAVSKMNMKTSVLSMLTKGTIFGLLIGAVTGGIVLASWAFSKITPISLLQGLTAIFVSITLGIVLFAISKVAETIGGLTVKKVALIGAIMVVASWSIKQASEILSGIIPFSFKFAWGLVVTSIAMGITLLAFVPAWKMYGNSWFSKATIFSTAKNVIIVAATIAITSWILSAGNYSGRFPNLDWSLNVGLSLVIFGGFIVTLGKVMDMAGFQQGLDKTDLLNIMIIAGSIVATSWILSIGTYDKKPNIDWVTNVGLSLVIFGGSIVALGKIMDMAGFQQGLDWKDILNIIIISSSILATSWILSIGKYDKYPNIDWVKGVGISLVVFGAVIGGIGFLMEGTALTGFAVLGLGAAAVLIIAGTIMLTSYILGVGKYNKYPSLEWIGGVGLSITAFSLMSVGALVGAALGLSILAVAGIIYLTSLILSAVNYTSYPSIEWVAGVGLAITTFSLMSVGAVFGALLSPAILVIAGTIALTSHILAKGNYKNGPNLDWAKGTGLLMVSFTTSVVLLGALAMTGLGAIAILSGLGLMLLVAETIKQTSKILSTGTYTGGPTYEWANGIGTAITAFAEAISVMGSATGGIMSFFTGIDVEQMKQSISAVVDGMVEANTKLGGTIWSTNYPKAEWAEGVGTAVSLFAEAARSLDGGTFGTNLINTFVRTVDILMSGIIHAALVMKRSTGINWNTLPYPNSDWIMNVGDSINTFVELSRSLTGGFWKGNMKDEFLSNINILLNGLISVGTKFSTPEVTKIPWSTLPYPNSDWIMNVGEAIQSFVNLSRKDFEPDDKKNLDSMIDSLISTIEKFSKSIPTINWETLPYPKSEWITNIDDSMNSFIMLSRKSYSKENYDNLNLMTKSLIETIQKFSNPLFKWDILSYPNSDWIKNIKTSLLSFIALSKLSLNNINLSNMIDSSILNINKFSAGNMKWDSLSSPDIEWTKNIRSSILSFIVLSKLSLDKTNLNNIIESTILNINKFVGLKWESLASPDSKWVGNIRSSLLSFIVLSKLSLDNINLNKMIDSTILNINKFSGNMKWDSLSSPDIEWTKNIRNSILSFGTLSTTNFDDDNLDQIVNSMVSVAKKLNENKNLFGETNINKFSTNLKELTNSVPTKEIANRLSSLADSISKISGLGLSTSASIYLLSRSLESLGETIQEIDMTTFDKLTKFSSSFTAISLIDNMKLQDTIDIIKNKKLDIKAVMDDNSSRFTGIIPPYLQNTTTTVNSPFFDAGAISSPLEELISYNKNIDKNIQELVKFKKAETEATDNYTISAPQSLPSS